MAPSANIFTVPFTCLNRRRGAFQVRDGENVYTSNSSSDQGGVADVMAKADWASGPGGGEYLDPRNVMARSLRGFRSEILSAVRV